MALVPCQVLRVAILLSYCSILCNYKAIEMPSHQTYGGSWKFLTFIDLVIQAVFFGICVLTDLSSLLTRGSGNQEQERQLKKLISLRDWMLAVLAFPVGVFVVAVFWIIYAYDREMIYPKLLDNFIPGWLNHGMHTTVLPFILIEMRTSHHAYPSRNSGLAAICTFSVGYILCGCNFPLQELPEERKKEQRMGFELVIYLEKSGKDCENMEGFLAHTDGPREG
ncbi:androgen-induced gene 1 protein isoform X6 [Lynx canadensis]|uniref:Androgen induced 1 n=1 Tax=Lynx canadensis TaxID=61383 RepID=A0A667GVD0_LYNCA|nr:androgen-induced gene 1 protein isoform X6 [Lynx canadensis]